MALILGSVLVNPDASVAGEGLAFALFSVRKIRFDASMAGVDPSVYPVAQKVAFYQAMADAATDEADALITHVTENAEIVCTVGTSLAGLQRTPNPNNPNTATVAPAAPVDIPGVLI